MNDVATTGLLELHDDYAEQVNLAVAEDRDDIIDALSARFTAASASRRLGRRSEPEQDSTGRERISTERAQGPLPALLVALTVVTGLVDAFSYLSLGHVFVANMTGNVVFIGFGLSGVGQTSLVAILVAVLAFALGAAGIGRWPGQAAVHRGRVLAVATAAQTVIVVSAAAAVVAGSAGVSGSATSLFLVGLLAAAMGAQNALARRLAVPDLTTTLLTMTVTGLVADAPTTWRVRLRRLVPVAAMLGCALAGGALLRWVGGSAPLWVAAGVLVSCAVTAHVASRQPHAETWR